MNYIIECIEDKEVKNLSEAINLLELESQDLQVRDLIMNEKSALLKSRQLVSESQLQ